MSDKLLFILWIIVVDCMFAYAFYTLSYNPASNKKRFIPYPVMMGFLFVLSLTGYATTDYYNYYDTLQWMRQYWLLPNIEPVYGAIAYLVNYDNNLFRITLCGVIYLLLYIIFSKYSINRNIAVSIYILIFFLSFASILRASLCDVIFYIGVLPFLQRRSVFRIILMLICCVASFFFHKSAFILLIPLLLCCINFSKKIYACLIYLFPVLVIISFLIIRFIFSQFFEDSIYDENVGDTSSRSAVIIRMINYIYWLVLMVIVIFKSSKHITSKNLRGFLTRMVFWFGYITLILMFNPASHYLYQRTLYHGAIPLILILTDIFITGKKTTRKNILLIIVGGILINQISFYLLYAYTQTLLNQNLYIH